MNERTAEEKLRQTLEGDLDLSENTAGRTPRRVVRRIKKSESQAKQKAADSFFMEDFERRLEQSLDFSGVVTKKEKEDSKKSPRAKIVGRLKEAVSANKRPEISAKTSRKPAETEKTKIEKLEPKSEKIKKDIKEDIKKQETKIETPAQNLDIKTPEKIQTQETPEILETQETREPEKIEEIHEVPEISEPVQVQQEEIKTPEPEIEPEVLEQEPEIESEIKSVEPVEEVQEIEEISETESPETKTETTENEIENVEDVEDVEIETEPQEIEEEESEEISGLDTNVDETETENELIEQEPESQELPEIPLVDEVQNDLADIPVIAVDEEESESENQEIEAEIEDESEGSEEFSPSADVVVNVDGAIPEQLPEFESENEGGAVPVTVEMPETTATAEDKLMSDLFDAMTGDPVSLDARKPIEPYDLQNFQNDSNEDTSKKSAEDQLLANIAAAMSESPLDAAADNAAQNFEDELNNLNENLAASFPDHEQPLTEEVDLSAFEEDEPEPAPKVEESQEAEKPETEIEPTFDEIPVPEPVDEPEPEAAEVGENVDLSAQPVEEISEPESEPEMSLPEAESEIEINEPEIAPVSELDNINIEDDSENIENSLIAENENQEEKNENEADDSFLDGIPSDLLGAISMPSSESEEPDFDSYSIKKNRSETPQEDNSYSEQSLLGEPDENLNNDFVDDNLNAFENEEPDESHDDFDINSLGDEFGAAVSSDFDEPETEPESDLLNSEIENNRGFDENSPSHGGFINSGDDEGAEIEKVSDLRSRLKNRDKDKNNYVSLEKTETEETSEDLNSSGGALSSLLWAAMLIISCFSAWQFMQLRKNLAGDVSNFESVQLDSNPSYEYAVDFIFDSNLSGRMSQRGKDGWKIVGSRRTQDSITGQLGYEFIFSRETKN